MAPLQLFAMAPKLAFASLGPSASFVELPWGAIKSLGETSVSVERLVVMLKKSPNLIRCSGLSLQVNRSAPSTHWQPSDVLRHNLRSMKLHVEDSQEFKQFFRRIEFPSLVDLRLQIKSSVNWSNQSSSFCQFLQKSSDTLQRLVLDHGIAFTRGELLFLLRNVPGLLELEFIQRTPPDIPSSFDVHVLEWLNLDLVMDVSSNIDIAPLLPNLRTLSLIGRFPSRISAPLIAMLRSRTNRPTVLQSFFFQLHPYPGRSTIGKTFLNAKSAQSIQSALTDTTLDIIIVENIWQSIAFPQLL